MKATNVLKRQSQLRKDIPELAFLRVRKKGAQGVEHKRTLAEIPGLGIYVRVRLCATPCPSGARLG